MTSLFVGMQMWFLPTILFLQAAVLATFVASYVLLHKRIHH
jgi:hypothetical protein